MQKLEALREQIEKIDADIIEKLAARKALSEQIGQLKIHMNKAVFDTAREKYLLAQHKKLGMEYQLDPIFIENLFEMILSYSRNVQKASSPERHPPDESSRR